jgi:hypothetical protein
MVDNTTVLKPQPVSALLRVPIRTAWFTIARRTLGWRLPLSCHCPVCEQAQSSAAIRTWALVFSVLFISTFTDPERAAASSAVRHAIYEPSLRAKAWVPFSQLDRSHTSGLAAAVHMTARSS